MALGSGQCWPRDGEAKLEAGAAIAGRVGASQLTAVGVGQPPGDVQAETQPAGHRPGVRVQPQVPLEDPISGLRWDAWALILDGQHDLGAVVAAGQPDR